MVSNTDILFDSEMDSIAINTVNYNRSRTLYLKNKRAYGIDSDQFPVKINLYVGHCWMVPIVFNTRAPNDPIRTNEYIEENGYPV